MSKYIHLSNEYLKLVFCIISETEIPSLHMVSVNIPVFDNLNSENKTLDSYVCITERSSPPKQGSFTSRCHIVKVLLIQLTLGKKIPIPKNMCMKRVLTAQDMISI